MHTGAGGYHRMTECKARSRRSAEVPDSPGPGTMSFRTLRGRCTCKGRAILVAFPPSRQQNLGSSRSHVDMEFGGPGSGVTGKDARAGRDLRAGVVVDHGHVGIDGFADVRAHC